MSFFAELFGKPKFTKQELRLHSKKIERNKRKQNFALQKCFAKQNMLIKKLKQARQQGDRHRVDHYWEELKQLRLDIHFHQKDYRKLSLESMTLKKYLRVVERLEKDKKDQELAKFMRRLKESGLDAQIEQSDLIEQDYQDELSAMLDESALEQELMEDVAALDPDKEEFLQSIDEIIQSEEAGENQQAEEKIQNLRQKLENNQELGKEV